MKKTLLILSSLAALILASCTKVENISSREIPGNEISFATYTGRAVTKGTTDLGQSFNVESFLSEIPDGATTRTIFFPSTTYTYAGGKYTGEIARLWPVSDDNLDFYAVSPLKYKNIDAAEVNLIPAADSTISVVKTDGTADIVAARKINVLNGTDPVELVFGHKLTKVAFKAIGADQSKKYVIKDIVLTANSSAKYSFDVAAATPVAEKWSSGTDSYAYDYVSSDVEIAENTATAQPIGTAKYLIPAQAATVTAVVKYLIIDGTTVVDDITAGVNVDLPVTGVWGINKSVVYTLTLNYSSSAKFLSFSALVEDWTDDEPAAPVN